MGELMVAIALLCQVNLGSYSTHIRRAEFQQECQQKLAKCVLAGKKMDKALFECVANGEMK